MTGVSGPSDRRFLIAKIACLSVAAVLVVRLVQIQVVQHRRWGDEARRQWLQTRVIPARRGDVFDRAGRPLALTVRSNRVGVSGKLVRDRGALASVLAEVLGGDATAHAERLRRLGDNYQVLAPQVVLDHEHQQRLRRFPELNVQEQLGRVYPQDGVGAAWIGFSRVDPDSMRHLTGLELGLDSLLAGQPGRAKRVQSGRLGEDHGDVVVEPARHGYDVVLSLDADLQEICENRLASAVSSCEAAAGSVLIVDPANGDVLAAASWPVVATRNEPVAEAAAWINRNVTAAYEPGSVFKIFSAAALLNCSAIDTATVFDCRNTQFRGFQIREAAGHKYGILTFMRAFTRSSNVWFARSVANLSREEHYRTLQDFGFGQATGVPYPAENGGILAHPDVWSGRSQATLAIGQEVAVTPLQLGMAVAAVANGGVLYAPRLYTEVRDGMGQLVRSIPPRALRRVVPLGVDEILREAMCRVTEQGTGVSVRRDWVRIAGKTGTAQKSVPGEGYTAGLHTATFAGFLPDDDPRLVIVAVLDEPSQRYHYAAQSAAPLFAAIVDDIRRTTFWLTDLGQEAVSVTLPHPDALVTVPDVLFLEASRAVEHLQFSGLDVAGAPAEGEIVMQVPMGGSRVARGSVVTLAVHGVASGEQTCPDFSGLSNRQVRALASRLGIDVSVAGVGYAVSQDPAAGTKLGADGVSVRMVSPWP